MGILKNRLADLVFALFFALFVAVSVLVECPVCLGEKVSPDSSLAAIRESYTWGLKADTVWVHQPRWSRVAVCFHGFGFAPFYALFAIGFLFRLNFIRVPALLIGAAKLYAGAYYITMNLTDPEFAPSSPALFLLQSSSYMLIPLFLIVRMLDPQPFTHTQQVPAGKRKAH